MNFGSRLSSDRVFSLKKGFSDVSKKFGEENKALQELVQKAQQIKEALAEVE